LADAVPQLLPTKERAVGARKKRKASARSARSWDILSAGQIVQRKWKIEGSIRQLKSRLIGPRVAQFVYMSDVSSKELYSTKTTKTTSGVSKSSFVPSRANKTA